MNKIFDYIKNIFNKKYKLTDIDHIFELANWLSVASAFIIISAYPFLDKAYVYTVLIALTILSFIYYRLIAPKIGPSGFFWEIMVDIVFLTIILLLAPEVSVYLFWIYFVMLIASISSFKSRQSIFITTLIILCIIIVNINYGLSEGTWFGEWFEAAMEILAAIVISVVSVSLTSEFQKFQSDRALQLGYISQLTKEKNKTETIIKSISDALFIFDEHGYIYDINNTLPEFTKRGAKEIMGTNISHITWLPKFKDSNPFVEVLKSDKTIDNLETQVYLPNKDDEPIPALLSCSPLKDENNKITGGIALLRDIRKVKEAENQKNEFIGVIVHQLRGPLTATKWALDMIIKKEMGPLSPDLEEVIKNTYDNNEHLIKLVSDLLDVSRIEEGRVKYEFKRDHIERIVQIVLKLENEAIVKKNLKVFFDTMFKEMPEVIFDERSMNQVVQNILENAIKYTPPGGTIYIQEKVLTEENQEYILVSIKDTGIGIPEYQKDKVFTKFFRADNAQSFAQEGTGLGLYIAKTALEKSGGKIWFESQLGEGTTFYFELPTAPRN